MLLTLCVRPKGRLRGTDGSKRVRHDTQGGRATRRGGCHDAARTLRWWERLPMVVRRRSRLARTTESTEEEHVECAHSNGVSDGVDPYARSHRAHRARTHVPRTGGCSERYAPKQVCAVRREHVEHVDEVERKVGLRSQGKSTGVVRRCEAAASAHTSARWHSACARRSTTRTYLPTQHASTAWW